MKYAKTKKIGLKKERDSSPNFSNPKFRLPPLIVYLFFIFWTYVVLSNYYRQYPVNFYSLSQIFSLKEYSVSFGVDAYKVWVSHFVSIILLFVLLFSTFVLGERILKLLKIKNITSPENFIFSVGLGSGGLILFAIIIGFSGLLYEKIVWSLLILLCAIGIVRIIGVKRTERVSNLQPATPKIQKEKLSLVELFLLVVFSIGVLLNLLGTLTPETFYDSLRYHLGVPLDWILSHKIVPVAHDHETFFPLNIEILYCLGIILKDEILAHLIHFSLGLLTCVGIFVFCKRYFSRRSGIFAAVLFYITPSVCVISWKTAVELGLAFFQFLAIFSCINWLSRPEDEKKWLILSGIFLGLAYGGKYTSLITGVCLISTLLVFTIVTKRKTFGVELRKIFLLGLISFVIFSPWVLRNLFKTGNPLYPYCFSLDKGIYCKALETGIASASDKPAVPFNMKNLVSIPWNVTMGKMGEEGYSGPVFLYLLPLLLLVGNTNRITKFLIIYSIFQYLSWITIFRVYLRLSVPALPTISIILAGCLWEMQNNRMFKNTITLLIALMFLSNIYFASLIQKFCHDPLGVVLGFQTKKEYLSQQRPSYPCPYYQTISWANEHLPKTAKIIFLGEMRRYYSQRKFVSITGSPFNPLVVWSRESKDEKELYKKLRQEGITHILFNVPEAKRLAPYDIFYWEGKDLKVFTDFWSRYVKEIYKDCADLSIPYRGIRSLKKQVPQMWQDYSRNPQNYVYLYEIMSQEEAEKPHQVPENFFFLPEIYPKERWEKIRKYFNL